jgi:pimeloyl-ACP methyl ester carboxylesterase
VKGFCKLDQPLALQLGGRLDGVRVAWRVTGNPRGPLVAALGGISAGRAVADIGTSEKGWWCDVIGPGKALDTERYQVLGIDFLGGSSATTGPRAGQTNFPSISSYDQAEVLRRVLEHLRASLAAIIGASYGGMVALAFAERYPAAREACDRDQRCRSPASDGDGVAQRAARDGALCGQEWRCTGRTAPRAGTRDGDLSQPRRVCCAVRWCGFADRWPIPVPRRVVPAGARRRVRGDVHPRSIRVSLRVDRPAPGRSGSYSHSRSRWSRSSKISSSRSPTCARSKRVSPARQHWWNCRRCMATMRS